MCSKMYIGLHVKYLLFLSDSNDTWIFSKEFRKIRIKFHENTSSRSRIVLCGRTDMTKLLVAFCNFANTPKLPHTFTSNTTTYF